jgi:tRNA pseudouridine synthase 10
MQGYGLTNKDRGQSLKTLLLMSGTETYEKNPQRGTPPIRRLAENGQFQPAKEFLEKEGITDIEAVKPCDICQGVMDDVAKGADAVIHALQGWEYGSILIGTRVDPSIIEKEEQLRSLLKVNTGEPIKAELNREIGKTVSSRLDTPVDFESPDIVAIVQIPGYHVDLEVHSLFIYGRYRKLKRGIPQTHWPCRNCDGKGCSRCKNTGKMYPESVEELVAPVLLEMSNGQAAKFHGAGREDIDALMLGSGRPFVIEILNPRRRSIDLKKAQKRISKHGKKKVAVEGLRVANKEVVKHLKGSATTSKKVYKALIQVETPIRQETLDALNSLQMPLTVNQRTPYRVTHRRADRVRKKQIHALSAVLKKPRYFELTITCQGGLYVKEFISGDEGRTVPSVTDILGMLAVCEQLDVLEVEIAEETLPW